MRKLIVQASSKYREAQAAVESEAKAPRKIIWFVIALQVIDILIHLLR